MGKRKGERVSKESQRDGRGWVGCGQILTLFFDIFFSLFDMERGDGEKKGK